MTTPTGAAGANPVQLSIVRQEKYSRGFAVLGCILLYGRLFALIPVLIALVILMTVFFVVQWIMQFVVLFTGSYPVEAHSFLTGIFRLWVRMLAWLFGLTDKYPTSMEP